MITLLTDFGDSEYVGAMKGVIYSLNNEAKVVDLTHDIKPFDIRHAAYAIYSTFQYFPKATVHVVVVDPGVGTERKGLILELEGHFFVGPDNGVFSLIDAESTLEIKEKDASSTFHGRDIFAPIAFNFPWERHLRSNCSRY
jgi:S-adenosylmethionine hydrolase